MRREASLPRIHSPTAVAGPGPRSLAYFTSVWEAAGRSALQPETRLGDLDADGEDDPDAMEGVEEVVRDFVQSGGPAEPEEEVRRDKVPRKSAEAVPNPTFSAKAKGKQRAWVAVPNPTQASKTKARKRPAPQTEHEGDLSTLSDASDATGWASWEKRVIVSRPKPLERQPLERKPQPKRQVRLRPSGLFLDPPCRNCGKVGIECEEDLRGGACVACKRKKQACSYAPRRQRKPKITSKPMVESEDDDSERHILSAPPIATLASRSPSLPNAKPSPQLPTRAPPLREARMRATRAIHEASRPRPASPPTVVSRTVRRKSPAGSRSRQPKFGTRFFVFTFM
jgi:hypothetical protein